MYRKHTFPNGLRLVTVPLKNTKAVTVLILVGAGSKYENKKNNGISHFLEHMFFKGTKKRPTTLAISETLDKVGGEYNAFTSKEYTGYWAKVDNKHLDLALDWVSDIFINSKLDSREIEKEKKVIIEEINLYLDTPVKYVDDLWEKLLYGDQPAGWSIAGEKNSVKKITRQNLLNYLKNYYSSKNTVVVIAGGIPNNRNIGEKIKRYFEKINQKTPKPKKRTIEKQTKPQVLIQYKKTDQAHLCLGVRTFSLFDSKKYALLLLSVILGGNMSSRLWISFRDREGLGYYIHTSNELYTDSGYLVTKAGVDNKRIEKAIELILGEYRRVAKEGVKELELRKAKDYVKGSTILRLESSSAVAHFYGGQELLTGKILTPEEKFAKIEAVTVDDIFKVANDIFRPEKLNLALIGPFKNKEKFKKLLSA